MLFAANKASTALLDSLLQYSPGNPVAVVGMVKYYVLRLGRSFKILYMETATAELWKKEGWELRAYDSHEKAQVAMSKWEADVQKPFARQQSA